MSDEKEPKFMKDGERLYFNADCIFGFDPAADNADKTVYWRIKDHRIIPRHSRLRRAINKVWGYFTR